VRVRYFLVAMLAFPARADDLSSFLANGPAVRIETDAHGKLRQSVCVAEVDAPIELVWQVLTDYAQYRSFMPRVDKMEIEREGQDTLLTMRLDTPIVATSYTNRMSPDPATHTLTVRNVSGDLSGSHYRWRLASLGPARTRITYSGIVKNFSSIAQSFDDEQQTLTIGINVVTLMATVKAVAARAEGMHAPAPAGK
jgi:carbon monoxide dehydrogenase subunit G